MADSKTVKIGDVEIEVEGDWDFTRIVRDTRLEADDVVTTFEEEENRGETVTIRTISVNSRELAERLYEALVKEYGGTEDARLHIDPASARAMMILRASRQIMGREPTEQMVAEMMVAVVHGAVTCDMPNRLLADIANSIRGAVEDLHEEAMENMAQDEFRARNGKHDA